MEHRDITIDAGATYHEVLEFTSPDGAPIDLTGCHLRGQLRRTYDSTEAVDFTFRPLAEVHRYEAELTPEVTEKLEAGAWVYDYELEWPTTRVDRIVGGVATVTPQVTRSVRPVAAVDAASEDVAAVEDAS